MKSRRVWARVDAGGVGVRRMRVGVTALRVLAYVWALPTTVVGLPFLALALLTGGGVQLHTGVLEVYGGWVAWLLRHGTLVRGGASALTLGHVVLGRDRAALERTRGHERSHVRQCERWGPAFIPAYLAVGAWLLLRGRDAYRDNPFEREAFEREQG